MKTEKGVFTLRENFTVPTDTSMYECMNCKESETEHFIKDERRGSTDNSSHWWAEIPVTYRVCSGCKREDGGWVSADMVGGGW